MHQKETDFEDEENLVEEVRRAEQEFIQYVRRQNEDLTEEEKAQRDTEIDRRLDEIVHRRTLEKRRKEAIEKIWPRKPRISLDKTGNSS